MFQVCERRKHQLIESRVSCYCVQKSMNATVGVPYQIKYMSLDVGKSDTESSYPLASR